MRITTLNLNGLRSATRKGFKKWLSQVETDVICLQEVLKYPNPDDWMDQEAANHMKTNYADFEATVR